MEGKCWSRAGPMWSGAPRNLTESRRVGTIIQALHQASPSVIPPETAQWDTRSEPDSQELICYNDLAPWNLVCGVDRWMFIDWDAAAPGTRFWDLAWESISFPAFEPGWDLQVAAAAMHALREDTD